MWNEKEWEEGRKKAEKTYPLKGLSSLPNMPGISEKHIKWKSLRWMITQDTKGEIRKGFFRHPLRYGWAFLKSIVKKKSFVRDGDFFFYGIKNVDEFKRLIQTNDHLFVLGFSYCQKPFECPSGRFSSDCIHDADHPVCRQCFVGKAFHAMPENTIPLVIPTIHYIGGQILDLIHKNPDKQIFFLITACEMTLEMFGDWGNMAGIKGIGVRLDGRICNTMKAFELSEKGIKPGLTVLLNDTQTRIIDLLRNK